MTDLQFLSQDDEMRYLLYGTFPVNWSEEQKAALRELSLEKSHQVYGFSAIERLQGRLGIIAATDFVKGIRQLEAQAGQSMHEVQAMSTAIRALAGEQVV